MSAVVTSPDDLKRAAAARAVAFVEPGMRLGLGTGSTARHFLALLAERVRGGLAMRAVRPGGTFATRLGRNGLCRKRRDHRRRPHL